MKMDSTTKTDINTSLKTTIEKIGAAPGQRILVVSDIHGQREWLERLLDKMEYGGDDILVIIGDLIEKGPDSLGVVRYVMDLCMENYVYVSMGNVDWYRLQYFYDESPEAGEKFAKYIRRGKAKWGSSFGQEMLEDMGVSPDQVTEENATEYLAQIRRKFKRELNFLKGLPVILVAGQYLFVHGGVYTDDLKTLEGSDAATCLKNDDFWSKGYRFEQYTVVTGHWPVCLYRQDREDVSPLFDPERKIICIDGGCGVKKAGQLNGLIFPDCMVDMDEIQWTSYDDFRVVKALESQEGMPASLHITYFDSEVELLESEGETAKIRHLASGEILELPKSFLYEYEKPDGNLHCGDFCNEKLAVEAGDELSLIFQTEEGCYVKKQGRIGWYCGNAARVLEF